MASEDIGKETRVVAPGGAVTNLGGVVLPGDVFEEILLQLPIDDVHHCMTWYEILRRNGFWKSYIRRHYDPTPVDDIRKSNLVGSTLGDWESEDNGFYNYELTEPYVFKPFPKLLKCDIIVGAGYNPMVGMVSDGKDKSETTGASESKKIDYHNLAISISILRHMLKRSQEFGCTSIAHATESDGTLMTWLAPHEDSQKQPGVDWVMSYFNANTQLYKGEETFENVEQEELTGTKFHGTFGMKNLIGLPGGDSYDNDDDDDDDEDDDDDDEDDDEKRDEILERKKSFQKWLQRLYRPSYNFCCGENIMNPVLYFHYTTLAPGYVGGIMSGLVFT